MKVAAYGSWRSPIGVEVLTHDVVRVGFPMATLDHLYWTEGRPQEGGRTVVVRAPARAGGGYGPAEDVIGAGFSARTLVHEYGGISYTVADGAVYFSNFLDQRLYRVRPGAGAVPTPVTPASGRVGAIRYAAPVASPDARLLYCVRERHADPDVAASVVNDVVVVATDGASEPREVAGGHDFFSHVAISPDGRRLCWVSWDHPDMPWDTTELWVADLDPSGKVGDPRLVAGGPGESVIQPKFAPDGRLLFVSDRTGWWNLYAASAGGLDGAVVALSPMDADVGGPDWVFGMSSYDVLADGSIVATWISGGLGRIGVLRPGAAGFRPAASDLTSFSSLRAGADGASVAAVAGSASQPASVVRIGVPAGGGVAGGVGVQVDVVKRSLAEVVDDRFLSMPEPIDFPTEGRRRAHALFYPPRNADFVAPPGDLPPLIVQAHGGPTSAASSVLDYSIQFWTSRGFAVVDVNYGGSSGYGREYRNRLRGAWGVVDVDDCVNAARHLVATGRADGRRLVIRGGSAGGYTALSAITRVGVFAAAASYYGVADAGALARDTHKFESHYTDGLIGPWPATAELYRERSPLFHTDRLRTPLIVFQGLEDKVVPPEQAEAIVAALRRNGVPHAYIAYRDEQHGFRRAENIQRTAEAELYFYCRVLGITPADDLRPVEIAMEDRLRPPRR